MSSLGFKRKGRYFFRDGCPYLIDFVNPPVAIGKEPIKHFETLKTSAGSLQLLTPTDCVKDRLASFFHWDDQQALEQSLFVARGHPIDLDDIKRWAKAEKCIEKLDEFLDRLDSV